MASNPFASPGSGFQGAEAEPPVAGPSRLPETIATDDAVPPPATQATASFLRRLAGQSVNKSGIGADQSRINQTIYDASKGSNFFERERQKDVELGRKIERLLKRRDELLPLANIPALEAECDLIIAKLEADRDLSRTLVHVDADAFFANCEELADPSLKGVAFGVGSGVLTTASYEARKFGVRSGMAGFVAKKLCPHLKFVKANFTSYSDYSRKIMTVLGRYDPGIAKVGMDEAFLDLTDHLHALYPSEADAGRDVGVEEWGERRETAVREIREAVRKETGLTVSAGIAPTKMLAKICSDMNKPDGQFALPFTRDAVLAFTGPLPIRKVPGIGKVSERELQALGVMTCGDIVTHRATLMLLEEGVTSLLRAATGTTSNIRAAGKREDRKSIGVERTFTDMWKPEDLKAKLEEIAQNLAEDMEQLDFGARCLSLKFKTHDYKLFTRDRTITHGEFKSKDSILKVGQQLLEENLPMRVRLLGLRVTQLRDLRAPVKPGGLDGFVTRSPTKASSGKLDPNEVISLLDSDDSDNDDDATHSPSLFLPGSPSKQPVANWSPAKARSPGKRTEGASLKAGDAEAEEAVQCPICQESLPLSDIEAIDDHVDMCLNREAIQRASRLSSPPKRKPTAAPGAGEARKKSRGGVGDGGGAIAAVSAAAASAKGKTLAVKRTNPFDMMMRR